MNSTNAYASVSAVPEGQRGRSLHETNRPPRALRSRRAAVLVALAGLSACAMEDTPEDSDEGRLSGRPSDVFTTSEVRVCWENVPGYEHERLVVKRSVEQTWGSVTNLRFTYWGACAGAEPNAVHIGVQDDRPFTHAFGRRILGRQGGVTLNFTYRNYYQACSNSDRKRISCIVVDAVHEFGHVLGFAHEQDRADFSDPRCDPAVVDNGTVLPEERAELNLTPVDPNSVMNYCNMRYLNRGNNNDYFDESHPWPLSESDKAGMRRLYGNLPPSSHPSPGPNPSPNPSPHPNPPPTQRCAEGGLYCGQRINGEIPILRCNGGQLTPTGSACLIGCAGAPNADCTFQ